MGFDKKHYKEVKKFTDQIVSTKPILSDCKCPIEWAQIFLPLISDCVHREDYEGAKATRDSIIEFVNQFLEKPIPKDALLILPEYKETVIMGIVCEYNPKKFFG